VEGGSDTTVEGAGAGEREAEASGLGVEPGEACAERHRLGKILSPERRHCVVSRACAENVIIERHVCRLV
jgi:hypothetical protein